MDNNKRESRVSAVSVGRKLKEAREKKSLTIEQVQKQTKIHSTVIVALEEGKSSDTLTETYIRSFLKKYAQFLGLNSIELLKEYFPVYPEGPALTIPQKQDNILPAETLVPPKFIYMTGLAVAAIISILILIFVLGKISNAFKAMQLAQQKKSVAAQPLKKSSQQAKSIPKKKTASKSKSETKDIIPKTTPLILEMKVKEAVLVKLKKDGILFFDRVLPAGIFERTIANNSIEIDIQKAGSVELNINGRPIVLQDKDAIISLEITRRGVKVK